MAKLTAAQRKFLELADAHPLGITPPVRPNGFGGRSRKAMIARLELDGLVKKYPHGEEYEITDRGRSALALEQ